MRILHLTTPNMHGPDVLRLQKALRSNKYGKFYTGQLDSQFGRLTAQAVHRAKWWMGYEKKHVNQSAGDFIMALLLGKRSLPPLYVVRRKARIRDKKEIPLRQKALKIAHGEIGYREGANNDNKYGKWYGANHSPWCAMFVSACYFRAGSKTFKAGSHYAYVPFILDDARAGRNNLSITKDPKAGDIVIICWDGSGRAQHVGLFSAWKNSSEFFSIEGNAGDAVRAETRSKRLAVAFVHVGK